MDRPVEENHSVAGVIVTVDSFGNLISNIDAGSLSTFTNPRVSIGGRELALEVTYGNARPGALLALINSFGVVEIAKAEGSAAEALGMERGAPLMVRDNRQS